MISTSTHLDGSSGLRIRELHPRRIYRASCIINKPSSILIAALSIFRGRREVSVRGIFYDSAQGEVKVRDGGPQEEVGMSLYMTELSHGFLD